jgi:hypothetical protein
VIIKHVVIFTLQVLEVSKIICSNNQIQVTPTHRQNAASLFNQKCVVYLNLTHATCYRIVYECPFFSNRRITVLVFSSFVFEFNLSKQLFWEKAFLNCLSNS